MKFCTVGATVVPSGFTIDCPVSSWNGALTIVNGDANTGDCHFELNCNGPTSRFTTGFVDGHVDPAGAVGAGAVAAEAVTAVEASVFVVGLTAVVFAADNVVAVGTSPDGSSDPGFWAMACTTAMVFATYAAGTPASSPSAVVSALIRFCTVGAEVVPLGFTIDCPVSSWNGALTIVNGDANTGDRENLGSNCNGPTARFTKGFADGHVDPSGGVGAAAVVTPGKAASEPMLAGDSVPSFDVRT
ncbi:Uncharacterised protein [Mycobacteroides abscessus subsp. abscessus]|nr:Uncharacterised protein [Mycobacteroides abscessus subsp. abscessus]SIM48166.1 Uncharacterised protein [Mycobacteroides abscessus subsp. bolletii]SHS55763.1 Uncharacterised protein [Mycobacteroides abscessus subsp. abscessus]SHU78149.1 Uncharacterised protein [Mycobacteroides abscessus subsp. abscessus]SIC57659.1 Uncharacterised protein [Mycobacteroides abscessus subsp. abscessus]